MIDTRAKFRPKYGFKKIASWNLPNWGTYCSVNKNGGCGPVQFTEQYFLKLLLGTEHFVSEMLSVTFLEKKHGQASKLITLEVSHTTKSFEKNLKILKFAFERLLSPNIRKNLLPQFNGFSYFDWIMNNAITYLVISFSFFAAGDIFGIMIGKIQEGW